MRIIVLAIALLSVTSVFANNNGEDKPKSFSITGKVIDNTESLTGVKVILDNKEIVVYTDFDGNFVLDNIKSGDHTLSFSLITYDNKSISFNPTDNSNLEIELETK